MSSNLVAIVFLPSLSQHCFVILHFALNSFDHGEVMSCASDSTAKNQV